VRVLLGSLSLSPSSDEVGTSRDAAGDFDRVLFPRDPDRDLELALGDRECELSCRCCVSLFSVKINVSNTSEKNTGHEKRNEKENEIRRQKGTRGGGGSYFVRFQFDLILFVVSPWLALILCLSPSLVALVL
jgi:hypothetical protein